MTDKEIIRLEALSKLKLSEAEREQVKGEIEEIIEYFDILSTVDTEGVEPKSHSLDLTNVLREDEVKPSLEASGITANAKAENGFFVAPVSVEGEDV